MGFPLCYTDFFLPKLFFHLLSLLFLLRTLLSSLFTTLGLPQFLHPTTTPPLLPTQPEPTLHSISASLIRELLPVVHFSDLVSPPESCAVCLHEFHGCDEIRRLMNCKHVFHRGCLDRWIDHDQKTCPLCRTTFVPEHMKESFNERLWAASGISDFYDEYFPMSF